MEIPLLAAEDIEVKIKQVTEKGAIALLYKTARVDMAILDKAFGWQNWQCKYEEIKGNLYCGIGVRANEKEDFVWRWDCGIESRTDNDGNEKKGEASDAFKRAATKCGIGRELYTAPFIFLSVKTKQRDRGYELENKYARYSVNAIEYNADKSIKSVTIVDDKGTVVFGRGAKAKGEPPPAQDEALPPAPNAPKPKAPAEIEKFRLDSRANGLKNMQILNEFCKQRGFDKQQIASTLEWVLNRWKVATYDDLKDSDLDRALLTIRDKLGNKK